MLIKLNFPSLASLSQFFICSLKTKMNLSCHFLNSRMSWRFQVRFRSIHDLSNSWRILFAFVCFLVLVHFPLNFLPLFPWIKLTEFLSSEKSTNHGQFVETFKNHLRQLSHREYCKNKCHETNKIECDSFILQPNFNIDISCKWNAIQYTKGICSE